MSKSDATETPADQAHPALVDGSFAHLLLGRSEVRHDPRTLRLANYLDDAVVLPDVPAEADWTAAVADWPMYGNDRLGDCTVAAAGHLVQAWTAAAGAPATPDDALLEEAYIPGTGTDDTGRVEVDVLNFWRKDGIAGHQIDAYAYVDPKNLDHVRAAIYLFGGLYTGIALPRTAQGQAVWDVVGDGKTGDSQPGSWGGHAVPYLAYRDGRFAVVTWGGVLWLTEAFHLAYCDEVYAPISADFLKDGKTPAGFDAAALAADLEALRSGDGQSSPHDGAPAPAAQAARGAGRPAGDVSPEGEVDDGYFWNGPA